MTADGLFHDYVSLQARGLFAFPAALRKRYGLDQPGAQVEITEREDGILEFRPQLPVPASQSWFWTEQWQRREREAAADLTAGRTTTYEDGDAFLTAVEQA